MEIARRLYPIPAVGPVSIALSMPRSGKHSRNGTTKHVTKTGLLWPVHNVASTGRRQGTLTGAYALSTERRELWIDVAPLALSAGKLRQMPARNLAKVT